MFGPFLNLHARHGGSKAMGGTGAQSKRSLLGGLAYSSPPGRGSFLGLGTAPRPHDVLYLNGEMRRRRRWPTGCACWAHRPPSLRIWLAVEQWGPRLDLSSPDGLNRLVDSWDDEVDLVIIDSPSSLPPAAASSCAM